MYGKYVGYRVLTIGMLSMLLNSTSHAMSILDIKLSLSASWKERFQDVNKLNNYAKAQPVELSNVKIENKNINGAVINGGLFKATDWKMVSAQKSTLTKVVFREGLLEDVDFNHSTLTDVVFEGVTMRGARFVNATLNNVQFIHCTINGVNIDQTKDSRIEISRSRVINTSLSDGQLIAVFKNSILTKKTSMTDLKEPSSLTFEKSELDEVDLSRSILEELKLVSIKSYKSGFTTGSVKKVEIMGGDISFGFAEARLSDVHIHSMNNIGLAFPLAKINRMSINDCKGISSLNLYRTTIQKLSIAKCPINNINFMNASVDDVQIRDSSIINSEFNDMKGKLIQFENVMMGGKLDFSGAHIEEVKTTKITKQPGLNIITESSNVHF